MSDNYVDYEDFIRLRRYGSFLQNLIDTVHDFRLDLGMLKGAAALDKREPELASVYGVLQQGQLLWPSRLEELRILHERLAEFLRVIKRFFGEFNTYLSNVDMRAVKTGHLPAFGGAFRFPTGPDAPQLDSMMDTVAYLHQTVLSFLEEFAAFELRASELKEHILEVVPSVTRYMNAKILQHGTSIPAQNGYSAADRLKDAQAKLRATEQIYQFALHSVGNLTVYSARMAALLTLAAQALGNIQADWKASKVKMKFSLMNARLEEIGEMTAALQAVLKYRV